jgi:hypothetical protein
MGIDCYFDKTKVADNDIKCHFLKLIFINNMLIKQLNAVPSRHTAKENN